MELKLTDLGVQTQAEAIRLFRSKSCEIWIQICCIVLRIFLTKGGGDGDGLVMQLVVVVAHSN